MENNEWDVEGQPVQPQPQASTQPTQPQTPTRPVSPFANSPYEMPFAQQTPVSDTAAEPVRAAVNKPQKSFKLWAVILVAVVAIVASVTVTALCVNARWEEKTRIFDEVVNNKLQVLQEKLLWSC